jgi:hypothetical protein
VYVEFDELAGVSLELVLQGLVEQFDRIEYGAGHVNGPFHGWE